MKNLLQILVVVLSLAIFSSCRKNSTSWDTDWSAPIAYGSLGLDDIKQDSIFTVNPDSSLHLIYTTDVTSINFDSLFKIPDTTISERVAIAINLNIPPGTSFINQADEREFDIDGAEIKELAVKTGEAKIRISNPFETGVYLTITLPGVQKDGIDLTVTSFVEAGSSSNPSSFELDVDFAGYFMDLRGADGTSWNTLTSIFEVMSDPDGDTTFVTNQDSIEIDVRFIDLTPSYGRGYFGNRVISSADTINLDFMKSFVDGTFLIDSVNMNLNIINGVVVIASGVVNQLTAINSQNNSITNLNHPIVGQNININQASGAWETLEPFVYPININSNNSNVNGFIQSLPDKVVLDYNIEINPLGNISGGNDYFYPKSEMAVELALDMPTRISFDHLKFVDTFDLKLNQNPEATRITNGQLLLKSENYFPFALDAELVFLDESGAPIDTLFSNGNIEPGIPTLNGKVNSPSYSEVIYLVDENFINVINNAHKIMILADVDNENHPLTYNLYNHYSIEFKLYANIGLNIQF